MGLIQKNYMDKIKGELNGNTLVKREYTQNGILKTYWLSESQQEVVIHEYAVPSGEDDIDFECDLISINGQYETKTH